VRQGEGAWAGDFDPEFELDYLDAGGDERRELPEGGGMTRPEREVVIVAHRGMAAGHPENTLAAFRHSISVGFPIIEVDLRTTADGHIVIMHDETVDRTTSGTGEVGQMTLAEIRRLDAGSHAGPRFAGEPVPTYPEALQALQGLGSTLVLDIKPDGALDNERIVHLTEQHGAAQDVIVAARTITDLRDFKELSPSLRALGLVPGPDHEPPDLAAIEEFARAGADIIRLWPRWILASHPDARPGRSPLVQQLHDLGKPAWATADTLYGDISPQHPREDLSELVRLGVNGIITNLPELLRDVLAAEQRLRPAEVTHRHQHPYRHGTTRRGNHPAGRNRSPERLHRTAKPAQSNLD
jgi:glycerophosphoryl diester phosphodiesterase